MCAVKSHVENKNDVLKYIKYSVKWDTMVAVSQFLNICLYGIFLLCQPICF